MKNEMVIKKLTHDLRPWKPMENLFQFTFKWFYLNLIFIGICAYLLPWRDDFYAVQDFSYHLQNLLWFGVALTSALALYESALPPKKQKKIGLLSLSLLLVLVALSLTSQGPTLLEQHLEPELNLWRGRCGFIIYALALIETPILLMWAKKGIPPRPGLSGLWAAMTSAALGCLLMQVVCFYHNSLHTIVWHFIPLTLICLIGPIISKKLLKW